jgi:general stress protein 26
MTVDIHESREHLLEFLKNNNVGVLATVSNMGMPHAATIYVTFDQDLNIYFVTRKETRKSHNLHSNAQAALAIYNAASQTTLQAEGTVIEVYEPTKIQWVFNDIWRIATQTSAGNLPPQSQLIGSGEYVAYKLSAPSLRLAVFKQQDSAKSDQIFNVIPTQDEVHFNSFDKNVN